MPLGAPMELRCNTLFILSLTIMYKGKFFLLFVVSGAPEHQAGSCPICGASPKKQGVCLLLPPGAVGGLQVARERNAQAGRQGLRHLEEAPGSTEVTSSNLEKGKCQKKGTTLQPMEV